MDTQQPRDRYGRRKTTPSRWGNDNSPETDSTQVNPQVGLSRFVERDSYYTEPNTYYAEPYEDTYEPSLPQPPQPTPARREKPRYSTKKKTRSQCLFPGYVWLIAVGFALLTLFTHTRIASPDDLAAWWIGARLVDQDMAHALYAVDRVDFSRYTGPEWAAEAEKIKEISPFAHPYVHLPLIAYLLAPLSSIMSYGFFAGVVAAVNGISFVLIAAGAISLWTRKPVPPAILIAVSAALWLSSAGQMSIFLGQTSPMIYALIAVSLALSQRRPIVAGALISVAALIKMTPLVLIVGMLLFASRRKTGLVALATTATGFVGSYFWAGKEVTDSWRETVSWMNSVTLASPVNSSFDSIFEGTRNLTAVVEVVDGTSPWAIGVKVFFAVAAVIFCFAVVGAKSDYAFEICAVTVLLVVTAVSGVVWVHYGLLAIVPIAGAIILHRSWSAAATCMLLFAPFGAVYVSEERTPLSMPWATVAALLFPVILLIVQELRGKNITWSSVAEGVKGEFIG